MAASRSSTAIATWSISVRTVGMFGAPGSSSLGSSRLVPEEEGDLIEEPLTHRWVGDAQPLLGREDEHAELALVEIVVDLCRGLARLIEGEHGRQGRVDAPLADEPVRLPRLPVVREVAA